MKPMITIIKQIDTLIEQALGLHLHDANQAFTLCQKANVQLQKLVNDGHQYAQGQANLDASLSWLYQNNTEYELALKHGLSAVTQLDQLPDKRYLTQVLGALGITYYRMGDQEQGLTYFLKQLEISEKLQDKWNIARSHLGISLVIARTKDYELASKHEKLSLEIYRELGDVERQGAVINNMCLNALEQNSFAEALEIGLMGLELDLFEEHDGTILVFLHSKVHRAYLGLEQIEQAKTHLEAATRLASSKFISNRFLQSLIVREQAQFAHHLGHFDESIAGFKKLIQLAEESLISSFLEEAHLGLYKLYKKSGDVEAALHHHEKYHAVIVKELQNQSVVKLNLLTTKHQIEKEQKEAELLRQQSMELQQLVDEQTEHLFSSLTREKELASNLRRALDQTEKLNQLKSRVIEVVSHEFRTPLAAINNSITLIGPYLSKLSDAQRAKHVAIIQQSIVNLTALVRDIESVGESKAGNLSTKIESMSLPIFCASISNNLKQVEKELGISGRLVVSSEAMPNDPLIHIDHATVEKITKLLLSNAFKFSQSQVQVCFSVMANKLIISFSDQGIGIPARELDQIFELFERGSNVGAIGGLGVGLYLAKQLADTVDGQICTQSPGLNQGAEFTLEIPFSES